MKPVPLDERRTERELLMRIEQKINDVIDRLDRLDRARAALDRGRELANRRAKERAEQLVRLVLHWAAIDVQRGHRSRGRAGRIARNLRGLLSESRVRKILSTLSSARELQASNDNVKGDASALEAKP